MHDLYNTLNKKGKQFLVAANPKDFKDPKDPKNLNDAAAPESRDYLPLLKFAFFPLFPNIARNLLILFYF